MVSFQEQNIILMKIHEKILEGILLNALHIAVLHLEA